MNFEEEIYADERLVAPEPIERDRTSDNSLRPRSLDEYVGQEHLRKSLDVFIRAAKARGRPLIMFFFMAIPGLARPRFLIS